MITAMDTPLRKAAQNRHRDVELYPGSVTKPGLIAGTLVETKTNGAFGSSIVTGSIDGFYMTGGRGGGEYAQIDLGPKKVRSRVTQCNPK